MLLFSMTMGSTNFAPFENVLRLRPLHVMPFGGFFMFLALVMMAGCPSTTMCAPSAPLSAVSQRPSDANGRPPHEGVPPPDQPPRCECDGVAGDMAPVGDDNACADGDASRPASDRSRSPAASSRAGTSGSDTASTSDLPVEIRLQLRVLVQDLVESLHDYYQGGLCVIAQMIAQEIDRETRDHANTRMGDLLLHLQERAMPFLTPGMEVGIALPDDASLMLRQLLHSVQTLASEVPAPSSDHTPEATSDESVLMMTGGAPGGRDGDDWRDWQDGRAKRNYHAPTGRPQDAWTKAPWKRAKKPKTSSSAAPTSSPTMSGITTSSTRSFPATSRPDDPSRLRAHYEWRCLLDMQEEAPGGEDTAVDPLLQHQLDNIQATYRHLGPHDRIQISIDLIRFVGRLLMQAADAAELGSQGANDEETAGDPSEGDAQALMQTQMTARNVDRHCANLRQIVLELSDILGRHEHPGAATVLLRFLRSRYLGLPYEYWRAETQSLLSALVAASWDEGEEYTVQSVGPDFIRQWWGRLLPCLIQLDSLDPNLEAGSSAHRHSGLCEWNFNALRKPTHPGDHEEDSLQLLHDENTQEMERHRWEAELRDQVARELVEEQALADEMEAFDKSETVAHELAVAKRCRDWDDWAMHSELNPPKVRQRGVTFSVSATSSSGSASSTSLCVPLQDLPVTLTITASFMPGTDTADEPLTMQTAPVDAVEGHGSVNGSPPEGRTCSMPTADAAQDALEAEVEPAETQLVQTSLTLQSTARGASSSSDGLSPAQIHTRLKHVNKDARLKVQQLLGRKLRASLRRKIGEVAHLQDALQEITGDATTTQGDAPILPDEQEGDFMCSDLADDFHRRLVEYIETSEDFPLNRDKMMALLRKLLRMLETVERLRTSL